MKAYLNRTPVVLFAALAAIALMALGVIQPYEALAVGFMGDTSVGDLKKSVEEMQKAFDKMFDGVKRQQDTLNNALEESRIEGGRIHKETSEKIEKLSVSNAKLADDFKDVRDQVLELSQKIGTIPDVKGGGAESMYDIIQKSPEWEHCSKLGSKAMRMDPVTVGNFHRFAPSVMNTPITNPTIDNDQPLVAPQRQAGLIVPAEQRLYIRDLLPQARTDSNLIEFASEATFTNNARPQGDTSPVGHGEGEEFAESAMTFSLSSAAVVTIGHWIPASRQVLSDAQMLQGHISSRLIYGLKLEEEEELLTGDGGAGKLSGLNTNAAAYSRGVTNDTILDTLLKALLQVSLSNYEASGFVLHPVDWYSAMLLKDTQNRYLFSDPQSMVAPRVWAKPVVASQTQTQGKFLAGAFNLGAQIWDRWDATVRISENVDDHFIRGMVAILAEERLALTIYRSTAFVYGNTSHAG